jgi:hypothetical protein
MYYNEDRPVPSANVLLHGPQEQTTETETSGDYSVMGVPQGDWSVEPLKEGDFGSGISSLDAAYVLQAVTGKRELNEYQQLACDVSGNGGLSSLDAARILQFLVGIIDRLPVADACASDWIFVPDATQIENQEIFAPVIGGGDCQQGSIHLEGLSGVAHGQDFKAILFGDCTGNWTMSAPGAARAAMATNGPQIIAGKLRGGKSGKLWLPIYVRARAEFNALEVALRFDPEMLAVTGARAAGQGGPNVVVTHSSARPGNAAVALASAEAMRSGRVLLVELEARGKGRTFGTVAVTGGTVDEEIAIVAKQRSHLSRP